MKALLTLGEQFASGAKNALEHHPKTITALIAAMLLGGGGGAFAVASLGPDASLLPVREVLEAVEPLPLQAQSEALEFHSFSLFTNETVRATDTVDSLLARLGINDPVAASFIRQDPVARSQLLASVGRNVTAEATDARNLVRLQARWGFDDLTKFKRLVVEKLPSGQFTARVEMVPLTSTLRVGSGTISSSLFAAADQSNIPDQVTTQLVDIFSGDIDFQRKLRKGDRFSVVYEMMEADGEPLRTGRVISAEFVNDNRTHQAMWFQQQGSRGGYYDFNGESLERAYLASPMQVTRVTSGFAMRMHPIHKVWRAHTGVDYGAPTGAPVRTVADGRVSFAGVMGGYGNVVQVDHGRGDVTLYAHLSRINVRLNQQVARGEFIGAVGSTGWATGPHLHFEFRQNGVFKDPLEVARKSERTVLSAQAKPEFDKAAQALRAQLAAAATANLVATAR